MQQSTSRKSEVSASALMRFALVLALSGCASISESLNPSMPSVDHVTSMAAFVRQLGPAVDKPKLLSGKEERALFEFAPSPVHKIDGDFEYQRVSACHVKDEFRRTESLHGIFSSVCRNRGGIYQYSFCVDPADTDHVLFMIYASAPERGCRDNGYSFSLTSLEPLLGRDRSSGYVAQLLREGFVPKAVREAGEHAARKRALLAAEEQRKKELRQRITGSTPIGTMICHEQEGTAYQNHGPVSLSPVMDPSVAAMLVEYKGLVHVVGFVEAFADPRIQIRVSGMHLVDKTLQTQKVIELASVGYQGSVLSPNTIIWDQSSNWHTCE